MHSAACIFVLLCLAVPAAAPHALGRPGVLALAQNGVASPLAQAQVVASARAPTQIVDRIVALVEGEPITLSEMRELAAFQQLTGGPPASDEELLERLIAQWIVSSEAAAARFPGPTSAELDRELARLAGQFSSPAAFARRLRRLGLNQAAARRQLERQLHLSRYLDHRFRPVAQVQDPAIERYYRETLAPQLAARGESVPSLDAVREQIREVLVQTEISRLATRWLDESRARLRVEIRLGGSQ